MGTATATAVAREFDCRMNIAAKLTVAGITARNAWSHSFRDGGITKNIHIKKYNLLLRETVCVYETRCGEHEYTVNNNIYMRPYIASEVGTATATAVAPEFKCRMNIAAQLTVVSIHRSQRVNSPLQRRGYHEKYSYIEI